jgi:uncharacterized protein YdaU (DUF1376 family)
VADFPALPLWTDSFIADTIHLDATETGAYMMLLMVAWRRPSNDLPDDEKQLAKFSRCGLKQWRRIAPVVMQFWHLREGSWRQKKLDKVRRTVEAQRDQKSRAGKASALKRQQTGQTAVDEPYQQPKPYPKPKDFKKDIYPPDLPFDDGNVTPLPKRTNGTKAGFADFWKAYPRREGKIAAEKAFDKAAKIAPVGDIMAGVSRAACHWQQTDRDREFIPLPATWLNQGRWCDEFEPPGSSAGMTSDDVRRKMHELGFD